MFQKAVENLPETSKKPPKNLPKASRNEVRNRPGTQNPKKLTFSINPVLRLGSFSALFPVSDPLKKRTLFQLALRTPFWPFWDHFGPILMTFALPKRSPKTIGGISEKPSISWEGSSKSRVRASPEPSKTTPKTLKIQECA